MRRLRRRHVPVRCMDARESISARFDGEKASLSGSVVEAHLEACRSCREFRVAAARITRGFAIRASQGAPSDLIEILVSLAGGSGSSSSFGDLDASASIGTMNKRPSLRWAASLVPAIFVGVFVPLGVSAHGHVIPTRDPTPCTAHLHQVRPPN